MLRNILIACAIALASTAGAGAVASCDQLDADNRGVEVRLDDTKIRFEGEGLVLQANGAELIRIDADRNLKVAGRPIAVPKEAHADLEAYVAGFRKLTDDAESIGDEGGRIAAKAITGLVSVMFTSETMDDYEKRMEAHGARIEAKADSLCRTVAELQRTEKALQQRIPAFPNFLSPANPAI